MDWTYVAILAAVVITVFMAGREIANWYLKINDRIKLQEETNKILWKIVDELRKNNLNGKP